MLFRSSDSVAVLPLKIYSVDQQGYKTENKKHPAYRKLNSEPNEDMTRYVFLKTLMSSVLLTGNGYAYIERRQDLKLEQLVFIPSSQVGIEWVIDSEGIRRKRYRVQGFKELVSPAEMIHVLNFTYDGIIGVSTLTHARLTLNLASNNEAHASGFFENGGGTSGILTIEGAPLTAEQKDENYKAWDARTSGNPNGVVILDGNMRYQSMSISPKDCQLLESRQFNVVDICRFFSVSPVKAFDLSKSSYSTVEATQLQHLTDTVQAVLTKIEQEITRKVLLPSERDDNVIEFDTSAILRADKAAQSAYWLNLFNAGAATPNEIRRDSNLPPITNGDSAFIQLNMQTLDNAIKGDNQNVPQK